MRIWYVVDTKEYWIEPDYTISKAGRFQVLGLRLYDTENRFKGFWHWAHVPLATKRQVRSILGEAFKREQEAQRRSNQVTHRIRG